MNKEKLKQEAEEYSQKICGYIRVELAQAYLASAEPREKRIEELEHQLIHRNCLDCSNHSSKLRMRNLELEKENAKLKEKLKPENCLKLLAKDGYIKFTSEQLTKAKELLKRAQSYTENLDDEADKLYDEIEQFLNSEVEK